MTEPDDNPERMVNWAARLAQVQRENFALFDFVETGRELGTISPEASRTFYSTSVRVMRQAGIVNTPTEQISDATLCTVVAQALHVARCALLAVHPELKESLEEQVPSSRGGRER
jgi:hypothetical protein